MEAVKQGSAVVGLKVRDGGGRAFARVRWRGGRGARHSIDRAHARPQPSPFLHPIPIHTHTRTPHNSHTHTHPHAQSKTHVVLAALKRSPSELASHQRKAFKVDDHLGIAVAGLISDGRSLLRSMRAACASHRYVYEAPLPPARLVRSLADRAQAATQRSWKRPHGVGLLVAGAHPAAGPSLHYLCPSGTAHAYVATAIGARSQASRTYLERHFEGFGEAGLDALVAHGLRALSAAVADGESGLTGDNCTVAVVGADLPFTLLEGEDLAPYLAAVAEEEGGDGGGGEGEGGGGGGDAPPPPPPPPAPMES
jgi:20S proteasome subunit alpha 6